VSRADSFPSLAVRYGVTPTAVKRANGMISDHSLHSRLAIFVPVAAARALEGRRVQVGAAGARPARPRPPRRASLAAARDPPATLPARPPPRPPQYTPPHPSNPTPRPQVRYCPTAKRDFAVLLEGPEAEAGARAAGGGGGDSGGGGGGGPPLEGERGAERRVRPRGARGAGSRPIPCAVA
jgi:hypothetical protein